VATRTIVEVARECFQRTVLPAAVTEVAVEVVESVPTRSTQLELFGPAVPAPERLAVTLGRLATRLGGNAHTVPRLADEYCPETSHQPAPVKLLSEKSSPDSRHELEPRPMRLLGDPEPASFFPAMRGRLPELVVRGARLAVTGLSDPERLCGHWSERPYNRDYYTATTGDGSRWWIFLDNASRRWFLHGLYD
jgi:hypothetical protein